MDKIYSYIFNFTNLKLQADNQAESAFVNPSQWNALAFFYTHNVIKIVVGSCLPLDSIGVLPESDRFGIALYHVYTNCEHEWHKSASFEKSSLSLILRQLKENVNTQKPLQVITTKKNGSQFRDGLSSLLKVQV